ncbi:flagellar basal body rod protein FlgB [Hoeflea prorocentri]|uniref:Flagellar basal body rod protein FlgB n=1 Tax=Hoeflea prorocentri TaxID=1922333 RepID=A0A9X3UNC7_9HYPH|nr:flagellar basal body rod protein FlgB [Hoeflea prorocentri]MCY6382399.1 flagellar basal body rod protein FlgB [Hoeflea prorocentri]MDA5400199.1 flagellar basal body rod protein FlgB [Hoeflea prorocentri]
MQPIQLFELASSQAHWLSVRQSVVAGNIANVNTNGYAAKEVDPFETVLQSTGSSMAATHPAHFREDSLRSAVHSAGSGGIEAESNGNKVVLEEELIKAGEIRHSFELNVGIVKSFHRMMLATVRK